jgi:hypothetical protein
MTATYRILILTVREKARRRVNPVNPNAMEGV